MRVIQADVPPTVEGFLAKAAALGFRVQKASRFGFRPEIDRSGTVPMTEPCAPIVHVAKMMREIRQGRRPMPKGPTTVRAAELLAEAEAAREAKRS